MTQSTQPNPSSGSERGLTSAEARLRLSVSGHNALPEKPPPAVMAQLAAQFKNPLIYILLFALAVDLAAWWREGARGWPIESIVIGAILLMNAALGVWQERKAEAALAKLRGLSAPRAWVLRDGEWQQLESALLAPGDLVRVEAGDRVPADGTLVGPGVAADESLLTGESVPVEHASNEELLGGALVVRGRSFLEISRTGKQSALGRLAGMLDELTEEATPLERRMEVFGSRVARWVLLLCLVLMAQGIATQGLGRWAEVFLFAVALAVAAVPEGLPAVMTLTLALGVERMAARKAVVRRLSAVEALGSVTVILTDKTGTLTENRMTVRAVEAAGDGELLRAIVLANDSDGAAGDPIDLALNSYASGAGMVDVAQLRQAWPRVSTRDFDSVHKFQRVTVRGHEHGRTVSYLKGAPETIINRSAMSEADRALWIERAAAGAKQGHRMLAAAMGEGESEAQLSFLGLVHLWDPIRAEVPAAIHQARQAGIRVAMVTGDHPETAAAIGALAGLEAATVVTGDEIDRAAEVPWSSIYARVLPEHKLRLVEALQKRGEVVAMTGDGVNDAPALKRSDVGIAMGLRGSAVSREVADIVLLDDNFATMVAAIEEGRGIYENVQKFIRFLFSTNLAEVIVIAVGVMLSSLLGLQDPTGGLLLPLTAVQILWINLVTDGLPALALALDRNPGVMTRPPRQGDAPLLDGPSLRFVLFGGLNKGLIALAILGTALLPGGLSQTEARTAMFQFLAIGQLFFAYPSRHTNLKPMPNWALHAAVAVGVALQVLIGVLPGPSIWLGLEALSPLAWMLVFGCAALSWIMAEALNRWIWPARQ